MLFSDIIRRKLKQLGLGESKTVRSARKRLREMHAAYGGKPGEITEQLDSKNEVKAFTATAPAPEESARDLSAVEVETMNADALDRMYEAWHLSSNRGRFSAAAVTRITGAAFGNFHLPMRWVEVTDKLGCDFGVRTLDDRVTGFPYSTVRKRIDANETGFFVRVFEHLRESVAEGSTSAK